MLYTSKQIVPSKARIFPFLVFNSSGLILYFCNLPIYKFKVFFLQTLVKERFFTSVLIHHLSRFSFYIILRTNISIAVNSVKYS